MDDLKAELETANRLFQELLVLGEKSPFDALASRVRAGIFARAYVYYAYLGGIESPEEVVALMKEAEADLQDAIRQKTMD